MYTLTLGDARADIGIRNVSGVCHDSEQFAAQVNSVTRRLMRRGGWWKTEVLLRICIIGCRLVWPRMVGTVLGLRFCRAGIVPLKNNWWAVSGYCSNGWDGAVVVRDDDTAPCYNEITGNEGKYLRWNVVKRNDVGKTMRVYGFQYGGQPLQEKNAAGEWIPGITLTAAAPYVTSTTLVTKIDAIVFPTPLEGMSYLYQVDATTGDLLDLGAYQPGENRPCYRVSHIDGINSIPHRTDEYDRHIRQGEALVKLEFIPAVRDEDFIMLDNVDALRLGIQALRLEEANDDVQATIKWTLAIKELNMELRDRNPSAQTVIRTNDIGAHRPILSAF